MTESQVLHGTCRSKYSEFSEIREKSFLPGSNTRQNPYLSTIGTEVDKVTKPSFDYTKGLGNVPILLRSEELAHLVEMR